MSGKLGKSITVKQTRSDFYKVVTLKNTTIHPVGWTLTKSEVDRLISSGYDITIK